MKKIVSFVALGLMVAQPLAAQQCVTTPMSGKNSLSFQTDHITTHERGRAAVTRIGYSGEFFRQTPNTQTGYSVSAAWGTFDVNEEDFLTEIRGEYQAGRNLMGDLAVCFGSGLAIAAYETTGSGNLFRNKHFEVPLYGGLSYGIDMDDFVVTPFVNGIARMKHGGYIFLGGTEDLYLNSAFEVAYGARVDIPFSSVFFSVRSPASDWRNQRDIHFGVSLNW